MSTLKNPLHERFLREYMKTGNRAEAYRRVYAGRWTSIEGSHVTGVRIFYRPDVQARYQELVQQHMKKSDISIGKILGDYQYALDLAKGQGKAADIVTAAREQARLVGLLRDRIETGSVGDFDNAEDISEIIEAIGRDVGPEAAMALMKAFGLDEVDKAGEQPDLREIEPPSDAVN